jgi:hypothetical protein
MCKSLEKELARGNKLAAALVAHMDRMSGASRVEIPVHKGSGDGLEYQEWKVTVELVSVTKGPLCLPSA